MNIFLDMDGVLSDFLGGAIKVCNKITDRNDTVEEYASTYGKWGIDEYYNIPINDMWNGIEHTPDFWLNLEPLPWAFFLFDYVKTLGDVTIVTSPSLDPDCARQKLEWARWFGIRPKDVFIGSKKFLMAGNGILIDDWDVNCNKFTESGGYAINTPSNWNTLNLTWNDIKKVIYNGIQIRK